MILDVAEIEQELRDNALSIGRQCLPGAREEGGYLKAGDVMGSPGDSLVLYLKGTKAGTWRDYAGTDYGDMLDLIEKSQGCANKGQAVAIAKEWLGKRDDWSGGRNTPIDEAERARRAEYLRQQKEARAQAEQNEKMLRIRRAKALYLESDARPIAGTPAEAYLLGRGRIPGPAGSWPNALRYHGEVYNKEERVKLPAMLAPVYFANGDQVATHRTWLQPCPRRGWTKLDVKEPRKVLGPSWGGFIPINKGASGKSMANMPPEEPVYMAEGIEKCLAVRELRPQFRIIAGISVGNMGAIVLPPACRKLVMVCDRDEKPTAIDALERSMAQQQARGLDVRLVMPPEPFKDFDEWLDAARQGKAA